MKIALTPALLLGTAGLAAAFPCLWSGSGSSYVYEDIQWGATDADYRCIEAFDTVHAQTTCCRCADAAECNGVFPLNGLNLNIYNDARLQGCDLYAPQISIGDSAGGDALPGQWFTSPSQLVRYLESTVQCKDDCVNEPTCDISVQYTSDGTVTGADLCGNTIVKVSSSDWVGCNNKNTAFRNFLVRYDAKAPTVTVDLGEFAYKPLPKEKLEQVPLTVTVADICDPNPEVTITVFSDEVGLSDKHTEVDALLARRYTTAGLNDGWDIWLDRKRYAVKQCEHEFACQVPDGRYYVVRVCAKDQAGWVTCKEDSVGVPLKPVIDKKIDPVNQGKLFVVAEDTVWWREEPSQFPYRARNTNLNVDGTVIPYAYNDARLCYSNRGVQTGTQTQIAAPTSYTNVQGSDECAVLCREKANCRGFTFSFADNNYAANTCTLYDSITVANSLITAGGGASNRINLYMMNGYACPCVNGNTC